MTEANFKRPPETVISYSTRSNRATKMKDEKLKALFNKLDTDNDGKILICELKEYLSDPDSTEIGQTNITNLLDKVDADRSGTIEMEEFALMMTDPRVEKQLYRRLLYNIATSWTPKDQRQQAIQLWHVDKAGCYAVPPVFIIALSLIQIITFLVNAIRSDQNWLFDCVGCFSNNGTQNSNVTTNPLAYLAVNTKYVYPLITYAMLHQGFRQLFYNVFMQLLLGIPIEMVHRLPRIVLLYTSGVVIGALVHYLAHPDRLLVGSSGGVYALITLALVKSVVGFVTAVTRKNWRHMPEPWLRLIILFGFTSLDFINLTVVRTEIGGPCNALHWTGHVGGILAGLTLSLAIIDKERLPESWQKWSHIVSYAVFGTLVLGLVTAVLAVSVTSDHPITNYSTCVHI